VTQTESAAKVAEADGESSGPRVQASGDIATGPAESRSEAGPSDAGGSGAGIVTIQSSARAAVAYAAAAARQASVVDPTPSDEGGTIRLAEAPALEESGGGGALIIAGVPSTSPAADPVGSNAAAPNPVGPAAPSLSAVSESPRSAPANDVPSSSEPGRDGVLVMNAGAGTPRTTMAFDPAGMPRAFAILETVDAAQAEGDSDLIEAATVQEASPSPRCADLLTEFLPFDRASLEEAIDRFLAPLEDLGAELANWRPSAGLGPAAAFIVTATVATEVVRRRLRGRAATGNEGEEVLARFPDYPWAWSLGES
jgi:hypothetical protein